MYLWTYWISTAVHQQALNPMIVGIEIAPKPRFHTISNYSENKKAQDIMSQAFPLHKLYLKIRLICCSIQRLEIRRFLGSFRHVVVNELKNLLIYQRRIVRMVRDRIHLQQLL